MRAQAENYKGIEFVRISTLPEDQKKIIWTSLKHDKIIKILKNDCLLYDCVQVRDYEEWYTEFYNVEPTQVVASSPQQKQNLSEYKLAFK